MTAKEQTHFDGTRILENNIYKSAISKCLLKIEYIFINLLYFVLIFCLRHILPMTNGSTGEKIKEKVKETMGMGSGGDAEDRKGELGPGAASEVEEEVAKTSSDSPTKKVEGSGKALGKEEGAAE
jgi:hypothetical protein